MMTAEDQALLQASLDASQQAIRGAETLRIARLIVKVKDYLALHGWPKFSERMIADAVLRFRAQPAAIVEALTANIQGAEALANDMVRMWLKEGQAQATAFMRQPGFRAFAAENRIDLGPVVVDLTRADPTDYPFLQQKALARVKGLSRTTKDGMRDVLQDALRRGVSPLEAARELRALPDFALTRGQARAVRTYREALEAGRFGEARARGLHDLRFKRPPKDAATIDRMVNRYAERMATYRARNIARTEMMQAVNDGNRLLWQKIAKEQGYLPNELLRYWVVAPENASSAALNSRSPKQMGPCPRCKPIPDLNPNGRQMDEPFETPSDGLVDGPLIHPSCRCILFYKPDSVAIARRQIAELEG
jgi:hypothetical protein